MNARANSETLSAWIVNVCLKARRASIAMHALTQPGAQALSLVRLV